MQIEFTLSPKRAQEEASTGPSPTGRWPSGRCRENEISPMPSCTSRRAASAAGPLTTRAPGGSVALGPGLPTSATAHPSTRVGASALGPGPNRCAGTAYCGKRYAGKCNATGYATANAACWKMQRGNNAATPNVWCSVEPYGRAVRRLRASRRPVRLRGRRARTCYKWKA